MRACGCPVNVNHALFEMYSETQCIIQCFFFVPSYPISVWMFALFFIKQIKSSFVAFFVCGCVSFLEFSLCHAIVSFYFLHTASPIDECAHTHPRTHTCDIRCCCWGQKWLKFRICEFECGARCGAGECEQIESMNGMNGMNGWTVECESTKHKQRKTTPNKAKQKQ